MYIDIIQHNTGISNKRYEKTSLKNKMSFKQISADTFIKSFDKNGVNKMQNMINVMEECVKKITGDKSFKYPEYFNKLVNENKNLGIDNWDIYVGTKFIEEEYSSLLKMHDFKNYVPFAMNNETGEFACFMLGKENEGKIVVMNAYAPKERLYEIEYNGLKEWLDSEK